MINLMVTYLMILSDL